MAEEVAGGRLRSPPRKDVAEEEMGAWKAENLGDDFSQHDNQAENQGIEPNIQMLSSEKKDLEDVEDNPVSIEAEDKRDSTPTVVDTSVSNLKSNLAGTQANHVNGLLGQHGPKKQSTWTRIMRMDYGLGSFSKAAEGPILGKRGSEQNSNLSLPRTEEEIQKVKREKLTSNATDVLVRVDGHPCREQ
nr:hypothetical protein CFP56_55552 [Quercus suber]